MRIAAHISHYPYPENKNGYVSGGGERVAKSVAEQMATLGHNVTVYTAAADTGGTQMVNGVKVRRSRPIAGLGNTKFAPGMLLAGDDDVDIVHVHNTTPPGVLSGVIHATRTRSPLVLTHHGNDRYVPKGSPPKRVVSYIYTEVLLNSILRQCDRITIPSRAYLDGSEKLQQFEASVTEIPNGINRGKFDNMDLAAHAESQFDIGTDEKLVFFIGDLIYKKGPELLINAASKLPSDSRVIIAGDGKLLNQLREEAPENTSVVGYVSEREKIALFNRADVFCLPSRVHTEVFPLVVLEAYASRTPVVASDLSTFDNILEPGKTGVQFSVDNASELAIQLNRVLANATLREEMAEAAYQKAGQYEWESIASQFESLFQSLSR